MIDKRAIDMTGRQCGMLLVIGPAASKKKPSGPSLARWLCRCEPCGKRLIVIGWSLRSGETKSCGSCAKTIENLRRQKLIREKKIG